MSPSPLYYLLFVGTSIAVLKELNSVVREPYMDEPFHVPQAQAYCRGEYATWDPKITTPPGLYILSAFLEKFFIFKCNLAVLRLTPLLTLLVLPIATTRLTCYHQRVRPPISILTPTAEAVVLSTFPIAWFFGFLYYTDVPSLLGVVASVVTASQGRHWLAALVGLISCTFRQTNIVWLLYGYASSQLTYLRFRRPSPSGRNQAKLHDPLAVEAHAMDLLQAVLSAPQIILDILPAFIPYSLVLVLFCIFVSLNGGIVLGDKSNHLPSLHVPQIYYFVAFSTITGWPVLISRKGGIRSLIHDVWMRMFNSGRRTLVTITLIVFMSVTVNLYTIQHPFLFDNRHYTFYVWRRVFKLHQVMPYLMVPGYLACIWAWFLRVGPDQTILQTLLLPACVLPTLLPTPLLEPRYFLIPYILLRAQVPDVPSWGIALEGLWYACINAVTMWVFLYREREGVGRFMW